VECRVKPGNDMAFGERALAGVVLIEAPARGVG
jgi:hypothetical protein